MGRHEIYHLVVPQIEFGTHLAVLHGHIHVHRPQILHVQMQQGADVPILPGQVLLVGIDVQISVGIPLLQMQGKLHIAIHLVELLQEIHVLGQGGSGAESLAAALARIFQRAGQAPQLPVKPPVQLLHPAGNGQLLRPQHPSRLEPAGDECPEILPGEQPLQRLHGPG